MNIDELLQTKAGQNPANRRLLEEAKRALGGASSVHRVGTVGNPQLQPDQVRTLDQGAKARGRGKDGLVVCVTIIRCGAKALDGDNLQAGAKPLRDGIATSLGVDDADPRICWQYQQVCGAGARGTIVKIDLL